MVVKKKIHLKIKNKSLTVRVSTHMIDERLISFELQYVSTIEYVIQGVQIIAITVTN